MDFPTSVTAFEALLRRIRWHRFAPLDSAPTVGLVVGPYLFTQVPWFTLTIGILYRMRGWNIWIVCDDMLFGDQAEFQAQNEQIQRILFKSFQKYPITRLSELKFDHIPNTKIDSLLKNSAILNACWKLQSTEFSPQLEELATQMQKQFIQTYPKIHSLLKNQRIDHWITPHGIYGNAGLYIAECQQNQIRISSYDAGPGMLLLGLNGVAGYQTDIAYTMESWPILANPEIRYQICELAEAGLKNRFMGKDFWKSQPIEFADSQLNEIYDIIIPLNIDYDSAALGKHRFFRNSMEWVEETVYFILNSTAAKVAVRQHPAERNDLKPRTIFEKLIQKYQSHSRFHFFRAADKINSYRLIENSLLVLPHVSTIGVESAVLGKKIILEAHSYYSKMSFAQLAHSKQEYFQMIADSLKSPQGLTESQIEDAKICYQLQLSNPIYSNFTPQPEDFEIWSKWSLRHFMQNPHVKILMDSLTQNKPACWIQTENQVNPSSNSHLTLSQKMTSHLKNFLGR